MPCLLAVLVVAFPRVAIALLYFLTTFFNGVYQNILIPLLGFIFLPVTLLAYTWLTKSGNPVDTFFMIVMIIAVIIDLGSLEGGRRTRY